MDGNILTAGIFVFANLILIGLGYMIRYRQAAWLIAGYAPGRVSDESGLTRFVGTGALLLGAFGIGIGLLIAAAPSLLLLWVVLFTLGTLGGSIAIIVGCRRYTH